MRRLKTLILIGLLLAASTVGAAVFPTPCSATNPTNCSRGTWGDELRDFFDDTLDLLTGKLVTPFTDTVNVEKYASLAAAVTDIGSATKTLLIPSNQACSTAITFPSTLAIKFTGSGKITKSTGCTLTFNSPFEAPLKTVFSGFAAGDVTFGSGAIEAAFPQWWGASPSATAATNTTAINSAIDSVTSEGGTVLSPGGTLNHDGIILKSNVLLLGSNRVKTILLNTNNSAGITINNISGHSIDRITVSQSGNSNSVDAISITDSSNAEYGDIGIDTPGRYGIALLGGTVGGNHNNIFRRVDIIGLSGTKRGIYLAKTTFRNNSNRFWGGRINNGAYGIYADTDSGNNNVFSLTVQEQTTACVYDDSNNNSYPEPYIETNQTGAHGFQIGPNGSGMYMAPRVLTVNGGGDRVNKPAGSPTTNNTYILIPPSGSAEKARLESVDVGALRVDLGSGTGQYAPVLKLAEYVNFSVAGTGAEEAATFTLPANSLISSGDTIRVTAWGTTTNASADKKIDLYFGAAGTRLVASVNSSTASILPWKIEALITRTGAATQSSYSTSVMGQGTSFNTIDQRTNTPGQDLAAAVVISVELTGAGGAGTVTMHGWLIEAL